VACSVGGGGGITPPTLGALSANPIPARKQLSNQECERLGSEARDRLGCGRELGCGFLATHREIQRNVFSQIPTFRIEYSRLLGALQVELQNSA
jgi:hypothetical protein